jgi:transposase
MFAVESYAAVRRFVFVEGHSRRQAARVFGLNRETVAKMCRFSLPPGYTRTKPAGKPKLGPLLPVIDAMLEADRTAPAKQRHTAKRIFERLRDEHGFAGGYTVVKDYVRISRARGRETFVPLAHPPGHQLQIDFGEVRVWIGDERVRAHLFVATLGYRMHIQPSIRERQADWFEGMEGAFPRFGCVPAEVLVDNVKALVEHHDAATREVRFNARLHAFARYWCFSPRACVPYRARTKGKDERGVGYVKRNAVAGRRFASWGAFVAHLEQWNREIADARVHGTTGELPLVRFADEAGVLRPLGGRAPFGQLRDLIRKVRPDCAIDLDTNSYSVPWRLVGETVQVVVLAGRVIVRHAGEVVADHPVCDGRRQRIVDRAHLTGLVGTGSFRAAASPPMPPPALLRPLAEYEALVGGGW